MISIIAFLFIKVCYHEGNPNNCEIGDILITSSNCSNLIELCEKSYSTELIIRVVENVSENTSISIGSGNTFNVKIDVFGDVSERFIRIEGVQHENVPKLNFGKGQFEVNGRINVSEVEISDQANFLNHVDMSSCKTTVLSLCHMSKVTHGANLVINAEKSFFVTYSEANWIINNISVSYTNTIPMISVDNVESFNISIAKNTQSIKSLQIKSYAGYKPIRVFIDESWDSLNDTGIMLEGLINMIVETKSWVIPIYLGSTISDMLRLRIGIETNSGYGLSNFTFGPHSFDTDGISQETSIIFSDTCFPVYLDSFSFGYKIVSIISLKGTIVQLSNFKFLSFAYSTFGNVRFLDQNVSIRIGSKIHFDDVDLSRNFVDIEVDLSTYNFIEFLSSDPYYYIDYHPKKYFINVNVSTFSGIWHEGKNSKTFLYFKFENMDPSILSYTELINVDNHISDFEFFSFLQIDEEKGSSPRKGVLINYTIDRLPDQTPHQTLPPLTLFPTETPLPFTPIETNSPSQSTSTNHSNESFFSSKTFRIASLLVFGILIFALFILFRRSDDDFDTIGNSLIV